MNRRRSRLPLVCGLIVLASQLGFAASEYEVVILHPSGFTESQATGVSDGQQVGHGWGSITGGQTHALLWSGTAESYVDLNPAWANESWAYDVSDGQQVGEARGEATSNQSHAMLWSSSAASYVDLHPLDAYVPWSSARGISDGQQVGTGGGATYRALLWRSTPESYVDLAPLWFNFDWGLNDCSGGQQVGSYGSVYNITGGHAALWSGIPGEFIDLNPSGFVESYARGVDAGQQVGYGEGLATGYLWHALLWSGTAASCVDLHPSGFDTSIAYDVAGGLQVGCAGVIGSYYGHALVWSGTAESYVDLHNFLPPGYSDSFAQGIDSAGNIVGYAMTATPVSHTHAVMWIESEQPPEPLEVSVDIKPRTCPNRLNVKSKGALQVAVLGKEDFDVTSIASAALEGIAPLDLDLLDVAAPVGVDAGACECTKAGPDGFMDLVLYFDIQEIVATFGTVNNGDVLELGLTGELADGTPIDGKDCVVIMSKGKP